ncbi:hypothetical protein [Geodermatophilus obscurus]|uniref:Uncharacterized protein n=1 Tax=Geodermatophilus obscurus (strain ATCC 25078 / DSM 43160 / JCM 3152 / CCUG 61914 / KCC A-0152 / KCTC 9177 / NBRC 13315 / NRRL B-3577 / G-20) TaxID=526225 RepID=D2SCN1_GEOOG|nr:hypothetical protein [Geodermatophilus obscurus]ADB74266.1 hypothetical protein Gobs_1540 [Geodermatophilus obscurus DSM 43160]
MSSSTQNRRRQVQRLALTGVGSAVLLVGIAPTAGAATGVVIPLEPSEVALTAFPVENVGGAMDPMADPDAGAFTPVPVQYSGSITVDLPAELDGSGAVDVQLVFADEDGNGSPDATYDSSDLAVAATAGSVTVTLPADDPIAGDDATLTVEPITDTLGPALTFYDPVYYELGFVPTGDPGAPAAQTVTPELVAYSQVPCGVTTGDRCPFPTPVTVGSAVTLDLTASSVLRELGLSDLTGVLVGLEELDNRGFPTGAAPVELTAQVNGSTASVVIPADTAPGAYFLVVAQQTPSGATSELNVEITVIAEEAAPVVPPAAAPTTSAAPAVVNAGLRSNTGVEVVETGSAGTVAVAAGAGMLVLAGVGGVAVARTRRRPAAEGGTCA